VDGGIAVGGTGAVRVTGATVSGDKYSYRKRGAQPGGAHRERSGRAAERRAGGWRTARDYRRPHIFCSGIFTILTAVRCLLRRWRGTSRQVGADETLNL